jgi:hypothetical protein
VANAAMFHHPIDRIKSFAMVSAYTLRLVFDDELEQVIDFQPVLTGERYGPLRDLRLFNRVRIDPDLGLILKWIPRYGRMGPTLILLLCRIGWVRRLR